VLFQTPPFLVLLVLVLAAINLLRTARSQHSMLLVASYVFYGWWDVRFLMLILLSTVIDYAAALGIRGIKLGMAKRLRISGLLLAGTALFLCIDWPALQGGTGEFALRRELFAPEWDGFRRAVLVCVLFAVFGPILYGMYFRLGETARRRAFLVTSIAANLGMLAFFKYYNFFTDNLSGLGGAFGIEWQPRLIDVALPVGISFYTFQTMSYTIDSFRGKVEPDRSLLRVALYVAYFPQLVAGPILRPQQFMPALTEPWHLRSANVISGFNLAMVGLVKKVLIADSIAPMVDTTFHDPQGLPSLAIMLGAALFAVQIYCDFSGYTDIARGVSRMFGVEIPLNFNFPYFSTSIIEFWRRWHISLSTWLRDYLYIPLGGSRGGVSATYFNLMVTMILGGLWHGAAWNFVIWGAYQGVLLCFNRALRNLIERSPTAVRLCESRIGTVLRWAVTAYLWLLGWLIFRVSGFDDVWYCMKKFVLFDGRIDLASLGLGRGAPIVALLAMAAFCVLHAASYFGRRWNERMDNLPFVGLLIVYALLGMILFYGWPAVEQPFIYFQF
jgi:alginate O-acetyltransferase complex protein AlgI